MSDEFAKGYLFVDSLYKNADLQRKQQEIDRLKSEANRRASAATTDFSGAGMIDRASYNLLREKVEYYEKLLTEPLAVIAGAIPAFKENYDKDQLVLAGWILSQKGFKEAAMKYGAMAGKTTQEIQAEGLANEATILDGKSEYGNNLVSLAEHVKQKLRDQLK